MKPVQDVIACVVDYGNCISLAEKLGETMKKVYYSTPVEVREYQDVTDCIVGEGLDHAERMDDYLDPVYFKDIDLFIFPDIGYGGLQKHLRACSKMVWGHMGADELELYRDFFLEQMRALELPVIHSETIFGLTDLVKYLKEHEDKWIKVNRYRNNMETWHHQDYEHSLDVLDQMATVFGGAKDELVFIVQDNVKCDQEVGYDGWCVDGKYPISSFQGYEGKDELYLGSLMLDKDLPEEIKVINQAMAPVLKDYGYRNWWACEIRIKDDVPYFIDPTARMPGLTGEHQQETCLNLADVIWQGANGILIKPDYACKFAAQATLHYELKLKGVVKNIGWKSLRIPPEVEQWLKLANYFKADGLYHFRPHATDEIGVVLGVGDSVQESIDHLKENMELLKDLPLEADVEGFADLLKDIKDAEEKGIPFGGEIPEPASVLED